MPSKINKNMQKLPFSKMIYPAITLLFIVAVLITFSKTIFFLTTNINKVFFSSDASLKKEIPQFDIANYELIRKRFNWPELATTSQPKISASKTIATSTASSSIISIDTPQAAAEKAAIIIKIYNGPENKNIDTLQNNLIKTGFTNIKTDGHQLILQNTIVQFKANDQRQEYFNLIKKIISEKYTIQIASDLPAETDYDVSILIGKK